MYVANVHMNPRFDRNNIDLAMDSPNTAHMLASHGAMLDKPYCVIVKSISDNLTNVLLHKVDTTTIN